jgi:membrane-bound metal-dependent hydrolase YbcI (DUF457 family)
MRAYMPTPVGHALGGIITASLLKSNWKKNWLIFALLIFFAELPDIDFLFGIIEGDANKYHHQFTHSFVFVLFAALLGSIIINKLGIMHFSKSFVLFSVAGASHLIFDLLALDTSEPFGAPVFWPFWNGFVISPVTIFSDVHRSSASSAFFPSLFSLHNFKTVLIEVLLLGPILLFLWARKIYMGKKQNASA